MLFTQSRKCCLIGQSKYSHRLQFSFFSCDTLQNIGEPAKTQKIHWDFKPYSLHKLN